MKVVLLLFFLANVSVPSAVPKYVWIINLIANVKIGESIQIAKFYTKIRLTYTTREVSRKLERGEIKVKKFKVTLYL